MKTTKVLEELISSLENAQEAIFLLKNTVYYALTIQSKDELEKARIEVLGFLEALEK